MVRCQQRNVIEFQWFLAFLVLKVFLMEFYSFFGKTEAADFSLRFLATSSEKISQISSAKLELCSKQAEPV